jgi:hypothetical protein
MCACSHPIFSVTNSPAETEDASPEPSLKGVKASAAPNARLDGVPTGSAHIDAVQGPVANRNSISGGLVSSGRTASPHQTFHDAQEGPAESPLKLGAASKSSHQAISDGGVQSGGEGADHKGSGLASFSKATAHVASSDGRPGATTANLPHAKRSAAASAGPSINGGRSYPTAQPCREYVHAASGHTGPALASVSDISPAKPPAGVTLLSVHNPPQSVLVLDEAAQLQTARPVLNSKAHAQQTFQGASPMEGPQWQHQQHSSVHNVHGPSTAAGTTGKHPTGRPEEVASTAIPQLSPCVSVDVQDPKPATVPSGCNARRSSIAEGDVAASPEPVNAHSLPPTALPQMAQMACSPQTQAPNAASQDFGSAQPSVSLVQRASQTPGPETKSPGLATSSISSDSTPTSVLCARMREELTSVARMSLPDRPVHNVTPKSNPLLQDAYPARTPPCQVPSPVSALDLTPMDTGNSEKQRTSMHVPAEIGALADIPSNRGAVDLHNTPINIPDSPACTPMDTGTTAATALPHTSCTPRPTLSPLPAAAPSGPAPSPPLLDTANQPRQPTCIAVGRAQLSTLENTPPTVTLERATLTPMDTGETMPGPTPPTAAPSLRTDSREPAMEVKGAANHGTPLNHGAQQNHDMLQLKPHPLITEVCEAGFTPCEAQVPSTLTDGRITPPELGAAMYRAGTPDALGGCTWSHRGQGEEHMDMNDNDPVKKAVNDAYAGAHEGGNGPGVVTSSMQQHTGEIEGEAVSAGNAIISTSARGGMEGDAAARMAEVLRGDGIDDKVSQELEQESDCSGQKGGAGVDTPWSAQTARTSLGMCPKVPTLSLQTFFRAAANLTNLSTCYFTDDVRMLRARRQ